jgi:hypothetical protein
MNVASSGAYELHVIAPGLGAPVLSPPPRTSTALRRGQRDQDCAAVLFEPAVQSLAGSTAGSEFIASPFCTEIGGRRWVHPPIWLRPMA